MARTTAANTRGSMPSHQDPFEPATRKNWRRLRSGITLPHRRHCNAPKSTRQAPKSIETYLSHKSESLRLRRFMCSRRHKHWRMVGAPKRTLFGRHWPALATRAMNAVWAAFAGLNTWDVAAASWTIHDISPKDSDHVVRVKPYLFPCRGVMVPLWA
jgi:hypothetical protein